MFWGKRFGKGWLCGWAAALLLVFVLAPAAGAQDKYPVDWDKVAQETVQHFQALIRLNTSNPPGNESLVAEYLKGVLDKEGIPAELLAMNPKRANMVARVKGNGSKRPVLLMAHSDVVGANKDKWAVDPFAAVRKDGYIWGRGTLDDKDNAAANLMILLLLKRSGVKLDRDVIFLNEAGEEGYWPEGIRYVVGNHWDKIDAEFALAEGGGGMITHDGKVPYIGVATTEKFRWRIELTAKGRAGHGSKPARENAIVQLAKAVERIGSYVPEMRLSETTRTYFERLATISPPKEAAMYRAILDPKTQAEAERYFAENALDKNSMVRTTLAATMFNGGTRDNVIPSEAKATIDIRTLPDEDIPAFKARLEGMIKGLGVEMKPIQGRDKAPASKLGNEMWAALEKTTSRMYPGSITLPMMLTGASDLSPLRAKGIQAYGVGPLIPQKDVEEGVDAHSDKERILEKSLNDFVKYLWYTVVEVAAAK